MENFSTFARSLQLLSCRLGTFARSLQLLSCRQGGEYKITIYKQE